MVRQDGSIFLLETAGTTYSFRVTEQGFLQHLYYGKRLDFGSGGTQPTVGYDALIPQVRYWPGNGSVIEGCCLEDMALEISAPGLGDLRESFATVRTAGGDILTDFRFERAEILEKKPPLDGLPSSYDADEKVQTLRVLLAEKRAGLRLELLYTTFDACDVITRSTRLLNGGSEPVTIVHLMSNQLDLIDGQDYCMTTFNGSWGREFEPTETPCGPGTLLSGSRTGTSSNRANQFFLLRRQKADENYGACYGFHLLYSGDHYACACGNPYGKLRILQGIQPEGFAWHLESGSSFTTPEAAMTWGWGLADMSRHLHQFVRRHILRGWWQDRPRPVLVNSWEGFYFNFTQKDLLRLARQSKEVGAELFVLDDGWFGKRDNDKCSLGDWTTVNRKKLPDGLRGLAEKVRELGLDFGIWVEPEMVNEDSELYRAHPDWILGRPDQAMGRNQYILDLSRKEVQDHLIITLTQVFGEAQPAYVKWDMNRCFTDTFSSVLPPERQGEVRHRYVLGLYRVLEALTSRFPRILFEACSSGGNRTDLGMLCYMQQVWLSDNTDALCRCRMQYYASYGYPQSVWGSHVSASPNHQSLRTAPLDSRFHVAAFGLLGYELDLGTLSSQERTRVAGQIAFYKKYRSVLQYGQLYRLQNGEDGLWQMTAAAPDGSKALTLLFQPENRTNAPAHRLLAMGLAPEGIYRLAVRPTTTELRAFGSLVNMVSPVRLRSGSVAEAAAAKLVEIPGETEDIVAPGNVLMAHGAWLKQSFSGTGFDRETRVMGDSGSRLYVLEREV